MTRRQWERAALVVLMCTAGLLILFALKMAGQMDPPGAKPLALDFEPYWTAARFALNGHARDAYDNHIIEVFERGHSAMAPQGYLAFYYPPPFLLLCLPLGLLPYVWALLVFLLAQAALLLPLLKRILGEGGGRGWSWLPVVAYPGFAMNAASGQNGGLTASCFAGAMLLLETRPFAAGMCLGALVCKPQMALSVPVALFAARRWRAVAGAATAAAALVAASLVVPGLPAWAGFLANAPAARTDLETLPGKWPMMQSLYADLRLAGGGSGLAYAGQALLAAAALILLATICWRRRDARAEMAALATAALLVTPFLYDYDLVVLAAALAWLAAQGGRTGFWRGEMLVLSALYILPFGARAAGMKLGVELAPPCVLALLLLIARRAARPQLMAA